MTNVIYLTNPQQPSLINSADALAYQAIILKKSNYSTFNKLYGNGHTLEQLDFGRQYGNSCAKYTIELLTTCPVDNQREILHQTIVNFADAISDLQDMEFAEAIGDLRFGILTQVPQFCLYSGNAKTIKESINQQMALIIIETIYGQTAKYNAVLNILSNNYG